MKLTLEPTSKRSSLDRTVAVSVPSDDLETDEIIDIFMGALKAYGYDVSDQEEQLKYTGTEE